MPLRMLGALPKSSWLTRLRRFGLDILVTMWCPTARKRPATHSRWLWTWVCDDTGFRTYGHHLGLVGTWWSGQHTRIVPGINGELVVPVDCVVRRPDPKRPGQPGRDQLTWAQVMRDERLAAFRRRGLDLLAPMVVADSCLSDSNLMAHVAHRHRGTLLVQGKSSYVFTLPDGRQVNGHDVLHDADWPWRKSLQAPGCRSARLRALRPTYGQITIIIVDEPGEDRFYLLCLSTLLSVPRLLRAWKRRHWIEQVFRTLKHLLATEACQMHREDAYYGHVVLRLMACFVLFYTSRVIFKGHGRWRRWCAA